MDFKLRGVTLFGPKGERASSLRYTTLDASRGLLTSFVVPNPNGQTLVGATLAAGPDGFGVLMDRGRDLLFVQLP